MLVHAGDLSPNTMLVTVTRPIEEQVSTVFGVRRVRSRTIRGGAEISLLFSQDADMQQALQMVQARVNEARSSLPAESEIQVERLTPAVFPILSLVLNGNVPDADLRDFAIYNLRPLFSRVPGVARIEVDASDVREISVVVDPQKALAHRITLPDLAERLRTTNSVLSVGRLDSGYQQFLILANAQFKNLDEIGNTVVGNDSRARCGCARSRRLVRGDDPGTDTARLVEFLACVTFRVPCRGQSRTLPSLPSVKPPIIDNALSAEHDGLPADHQDDLALVVELVGHLRPHDRLVGPTSEVGKRQNRLGYFGASRPSLYSALRSG